MADKSFPRHVLVSSVRSIQNILLSSNHMSKYGHFWLKKKHGDDCYAKFKAARWWSTSMGDFTVGLHLVFIGHFKQAEKCPYNEPEYHLG